MSTKIFKINISEISHSASKVDIEAIDASSAITELYFNSRTTSVSLRKPLLFSANLSLTGPNCITLSGSSLIQNLLNSKYK